MSASWTLHVAPYAASGDPGALERTSLVRDGFAWWAFLVPPIWLLVHRHWLLALALALLLGAAWWGLPNSGLPGGIVVGMMLLVQFLVGLESSSLRRWDYARQGRPAVDVVFAANEAEAEAKSFARWLDEPADRPPAVDVPRPAAPRMPAYAEPHVIGLFPDAERRR